MTFTDDGVPADSERRRQSDSDAPTSATEFWHDGPWAYLHCRQRQDAIAPTRHPSAVTVRLESLWRGVSPGRNLHFFVLRMQSPEEPGRMISPVHKRFMGEFGLVS